MSQPDLTQTFDFSFVLCLTVFWIFSLKFKRHFALNFGGRSHGTSDDVLAYHWGSETSNFRDRVAFRLNATTNFCSFGHDAVHHDSCCRLYPNTSFSYSANGFSVAAFFWDARIDFEWKVRDTGRANGSSRRSVLLVLN